MNRRTILSLYKKEMLDVFRDKKTIIMMVLVPLFLYPIMMLGMLFIMSSILTQSQEKEYDLAVYNVTENVLWDFSADNEDQEYHFVILHCNSEKECQDMLTEKKADATIIGYDLEENENYCIGYESSVSDSSIAGNLVQKVLEDYSDKLRDKLVAEEFDDAEEILHPIAIQMKDCATNEASMGTYIGLIIPFMLITSILMGAIYPAIDVTAGERERGTLETMMTLPVKKVDMMMSKFMAVSSVAVISAVLNMLSMSLVCGYMFSTMQMFGSGMDSFHLSAYIPSILVLAICVIVFAMFTSAICLIVCLFAKSFKEANNYSTPVLLVFMLTSMLSMIPGLELTNQTALIPVLNIALLVKKVFVLEFEPVTMLLVFASNVLYSLLAVMLMAKLFDSEQVLFAEGMNGVKIFEKRSNMKNKQMPGYGDLVLVFGMLLILMVYLGMWVSTRFGMWGTAMCQGLILLVPVIYAWYMKADFKQLFSLHKPKTLSWVGAILMWFGCFMLEQLVLTQLSVWFPSIAETGETINSLITDAGFPLAFFVIAICPAVAEEAAFRGILYGTVRNKTRYAIIPIVASAILFGAYHMNWLQFIGGFMMGLAMGYTLYKGKSIFLTVLMHFLNNGLSVVFQFYPQTLEHLGVLSKTTLTITDALILLALGVLALSIGALCLQFCNKTTSKKV